MRLTLNAICSISKRLTLEDSITGEPSLKRQIEYFAHVLWKGLERDHLEARDQKRIRVRNRAEEGLLVSSFAMRVSQEETPSCRLCQSYLPLSTLGKQFPKSMLVP